MHTYKVAWVNDCDEKSETIVEAETMDKAEEKVYDENDNCMELVGTIALD